MSGTDFTTRLQLELREAAERRQQQGALGRLRVALPRPGVLAVAAAAAALVLAVVLVSGIRWSREETITAPRVTGTFAIGDTLSAIAAGSGSVWVADRGARQLLRVDPATHEVTARVPTMPNPIVRVGAGAAWVFGYTDSSAKPDELLRIDPQTARITARTRLGAFRAGDVQFLGDQVWVVGAEGARQIDAATGRPGRVVRVQQRADDPFPLALWVTRDGLVALRREGRIERYDLRTGRLEGLLPVRLAGTQFLVPTGAGPVLSSPPGRIALAEPERGQIVWQRDFVATSALPVVDGRRLWAFVSGRDSDQLYEVALASGEVLSRTRLPELGGVDSAMVGDELWIATQNGKVMVVKTPPPEAG